jgi:protein-L-isoaspartate(D-aspartate) O-methyltransferase
VRGPPRCAVLHIVILVEMPPTSAALARSVLLETLKRNGINNTQVIDSVEKTPREIFVLEKLIPQAYDDVALPIGRGQTISQPSVVALMTQALDVNDRHKVLEVGTGSGYQASILARLCRRLYTIERHKPLLDVAEEKFRAQRLNNITAIVGDGFAGWPVQAPFDRIMVTAAAPKVPPVLLSQLAIGGILVMPVGGVGETQELRRVTRMDEDLYSSVNLCRVRFVPMVPDIAGENAVPQRMEGAG